MALPARVSLRRPPRKAGPGHFRTSRQPESHRASDRSQGRADAACRPFAAAKSSVRSFNALRAPASSESRSNVCSPEERAGAPDPIRASECRDRLPRSGHWRGQAQPRYQRGEPLHEYQRRHSQMRGAVAPGCLEPEHHLPCGVGLHAIVGPAAHSGVQAEAVNVGAKRLFELRLPGHGTLRRPLLLASTRPWSETLSLSAT